VIQFFLHCVLVYILLYKEKKQVLRSPSRGDQHAETGTRSSAIDLLALDGKDASNYVNKYLRLKFQSTFMDYAFDKLITAADDDRQQQPYIDLANRLFDSFESLQQAVTAKDDPNITQRYADTKIILQELMTRMA
jgi:photosystem II oxygen-evolving enhancer protein 3